MSEPQQVDNKKIVLTEETEVIELASIMIHNDVDASLKNLETTIEFFQHKKDLIIRDFKRDEQKVKVNYVFKCFSNEGAYAVYSAVCKRYGNLDMNSTGPSGDKLPELIEVKLPDGESINVPWGQVSLPTFDGGSVLEMSYDYEEHEFAIVGTVKNKFIKELEVLVKDIQEELDLRSIYKGRAIYLEFDSDNEAQEPTFVDLSGIDESKVVFSSIARDGMAPILMRIEKTKDCIASGLDIKYGALMEGVYGTGKTLAAFYIAKKAIQNKWTFIYLKDCRHTAKALSIAEQYIKGESGVVIFTEDIDQALRGERDADMQEILNTMDGGDTKCKPIISIFTTNHIEKIEPTFMRGKRIGGLISLGALDAETAEKFMRVMVGSNNSTITIIDSEIPLAAKHLIGIVPAFASEIIDKAKIFMIARGSSAMNEEDIQKAADSYKRQMEYAEMKKGENKYDELVKAINLLGNHLSGEEKPVGEELFSYLKTISSSTYSGRDLIQKK